MNQLRSGPIPPMELYMIDAGGAPIEGSVVEIEHRCETEDITGLVGALVRSIPSEFSHWAQFVDDPEPVEITFWAQTAQERDEEIASRRRARQAEAKAARRRRQLADNRVTIDRLVGHRIRQIRTVGDRLAFLLADGSAWCFEANAISFTAQRPWAVVDAVITKVHVGHDEIALYGDKAPFTTVPTVLEGLLEYPEDEALIVGQAYEPTRQQLAAMFVIAGGSR